MSMNTKSSPSRYRYCISRLSTLAVSTLTPALKVLSTTLPDRTFFSLVRTKAPPLPGLTCWKSTTVHSCPSMFSVMPFLRSFVVATSDVSWVRGQARQGVSALEDKQLPRGRCCGRGEQGTGSPGAHHQGVLDPDTAPAGHVDARLDGDGNPVSKSTGPAVSQHRRLVDLQAHPVPQTVREVLAVAGLGNDVAGRRVHVRHGRVRPGRRDPGPLRGGHERIEVALPAGWRAEHDRARHVGVVPL